MLTKSEAPSPFLPGTQTQVAWDSTSLSWLKTCPRLYQYSMIEGWRSRGTGVHLKFGQLYHSALEFYDKLCADDTSHEDALHTVVFQAMVDTWEFDYKCVQGHDRCMGSGGDENCPLCEREGGKPWTSDHPSKNRETLIRSIIWYLDQFKDDPASTLILANGKPAVELSFRMELDWGPKAAIEHKDGYAVGLGQPYILCGHLDRVVEFGGQRYVLDRKTTGSSLTPHYFDNFAPDNQMCQPAGTMIKTPTGDIPIEFINEGDEIISASRSHKSGTQTRKIIAIANRGYSGKLITISTRLGEHQVTPNHRCIVRLKPEAKHLESVYLMRKGNQYRIGITSLRTKRDFKNGLSQRCRGEKADAMWLIATTADREEAWAIEQWLSLQYQIPCFTFKNNSFKNLSDTKQGQLDWLWAQVRDNTERAKALLDDFNQLLEYPIYEANSDEWSELSFDRKSFIRACNIQHNLFEVCFISEGTLTWLPATVTSEDFTGVVHSLEISKDHSTYNKGHYFANGILTGNSIYTLAARVQFSTPVAGVIIDAVQIAVGFTRFQRGFTYRTEAQLEEWLIDFRFWTAQAEGFAERGYWPMNDKSCGMYGGCTFRKICSKSPEVREKFLESDFERRPWNPLSVR